MNSDKDSFSKAENIIRTIMKTCDYINEDFKIDRSFHDFKMFCLSKKAKNKRREKRK